MKIFLAILWLAAILSLFNAQRLCSKIEDLEKDSENLHKRISELVERVDELEWK
jgi:HPt (histidine-containing phosphotransfer) domain-containing protein